MNTCKDYMWDEFNGTQFYIIGFAMIGAILFLIASSNYAEHTPIHKS